MTLIKAPFAVVLSTINCWWLRVLASSDRRCARESGGWPFVHHISLSPIEKKLGLVRPAYVITSEPALGEQQHNKSRAEERNNFIHVS
jgi:hypothetical protein